LLGPVIGLPVAVNDDPPQTMVEQKRRSIVTFIPPSGLSESFCVETIQNVANLLCHKFTFPGFDAEEARAQAMLFAVEGLKHYDASRPLPNFLFVHTKNRLANHKRNSWSRADSPCNECQDGRPCGPDGKVCYRHKKWMKLQERKKNVRWPL